ncbi:putative hydroxymethylpyrimidine transporter CytX [Asticcacaulis sp. 201]|uniref:putative hydroxymethylpyrimidine transporter CytX n=1 Tax=Asticcacaulis sp. 201 TaxID=3028787 RepID=UPI0029163BFC|nr:putative hydroxymethylpyrimidine transporter CytX [Asticcacaulis sp. 201]MDV6329816.1 putative hydroxymethylpyrimidine transporter CytX [Asticcacaulis sp. 201]
MSDNLPISDQEAYDPLVPVPANKRKLSALDAFSLWFSLGIGLLVLQAGAALIPGLSLVEALAAIAIGSCAGAVLLGLAGVIGADTGLATMAALRPTLGVRGASVAAVLNIVQLVGWGAFEIIAMRDAANTLSQKTFHFGAPVVWTLLFGAAATALAIMGPLSFIRRFLRSYGIWLLLAGAAWLSFTLISGPDLTAALARKGDGSLSFGGGIDLVIAMPLSWLPLIADYARFGKSAKGMFRGSAAGYAIANIWFFALGAAYAVSAAYNPDNMLLSALAMTGGGLALLFILIDETDNIFADIFSAATSLGSLLHFRIKHLAILFGLVCTAIALFVPMSGFMTFLYAIGSVFTPLYGVLLVDHFLIRKRQVEVAQIRSPKGIYGFTFGLNLIAFAAWVIGIATYYMVLARMPALGATLPAFFAAAVVYWVLSLFRVQPRLPEAS